MRNGQTGNILRYCSDNCILVINKHGKIRELFTPFLVTAITIVGGRKRTFIVDAVAVSSTNELVYVINGNQYHYSQFTITINF